LGPLDEHDANAYAVFLDHPARVGVVAIRNSAYIRAMRTLSERDVSALLRFVADLDDLDEALPFPPRLLARLQALVPSSEVGYSELDPVAQASVLQVWHNSEGEDEVVAGDDGPSSEEESRLWWRLRPTHPVCGYRQANGDWTTPYKASDFATLREFRRTPIYDAFYRGVLDHWLDVGLPATATRTRVFIMTRHGGRDFDERDKLVLDLVRPHLSARAEAVAAADCAAAALADLDRGADDGATRVVVASASGVIEFVSPTTRELLARYLGVKNGRVPRQVFAGGELLLERDGRRLQVRVARTSGGHVLLLDEHDMRIERLTTRERQILEYVANGKENDEIALILGIARATVAKHLEHIYRKLGVPNRTAAAAVLNSLNHH
jgi:DNA-binding CsgD family transcriptional regulator